MIISFYTGVLFPPKQEVDFTSVCQTGNISLFYCFGSRENWRGANADVNNQYLKLKFEKESYD